MDQATIRTILLMTALATVFSTQAQASALALSNSGFEAGWTGGNNNHGNYVYNPTGAGIGWDFIGGAGVSTTGSAWNGTAYQGNQFAFLQSQGAQISQNFTLSSSSQLNADFAIALRMGYPAGQSVAVLVDNQLISSFAADSTNWQIKTLNLGQWGAGTHTLSFASTYVGALDTSAFLDTVNLNAVTAPVPVPNVSWLFISALGLLFKRHRAHSR